NGQGTHQVIPVTSVRIGGLGIIAIVSVQGKPNFQPFAQLRGRIYSQRVFAFVVVGTNDDPVPVQVSKRHAITDLFGSSRCAQIVFLDETVVERQVKPIVARIGDGVCSHPVDVFLHVFFGILGTGFSTVQHGLVFQVHVHHRIPDRIRQGSGLLEAEIII